MGEIEIIEEIKQGYMNTDSQFLNQDRRGGSCCVTAIIRQSKNRFLLNACRDTTLIILMVAAAASLELGIKTEWEYWTEALLYSWISTTAILSFAGY
ncbi:hypothetical protein L2E82_05166 [Cichorium intybus]|uniref:Uncharacterized protein n=1 Tax=Cichorium intybus TaxID=13427 RepID=A0ACB9H7J2_CICIN|nr:hypothetical protein L2E82_05166 [Cichorium intybus]